MKKRPVVNTTTRAVGTEELMSGIRPTREYKTPSELMSGLPDPEETAVWKGWQNDPFKNKAVDTIRGKWGTPGEDSIPD
jgi:hypothetical protein